MAEGFCILTVKAVPNAARSEVVGWMGDVLKIKLQAPPVDGKANAELCRFLAGLLDRPKATVTLLTGDTSRLKRVRLAGLTLAELRTRLARL
ncbi:MAG: DUF167 domain-containing protein [Opitutales bacterium]